MLRLIERLRSDARGEIIMKKFIVLLGCATFLLVACGSAPSTATPTAEAVQAQEIDTDPRLRWGMTASVEFAK